MRANSRPVNKGLRLDYFMCSRAMFLPELKAKAEEVQEGGGGVKEGSKEEGCRDAAATAATTLRKKNIDNIPTPAIVDSYILDQDTIGASDHCPVVLVVKVVCTLVMMHALLLFQVT